jgi:hypothetical protein
MYRSPEGVAPDEVRMPQTEEYLRTARERGRRGPAWRLTTLAMSLALILTAVLFPFDIHPRNGVRWIEGGGLVFDGSGIALMDESLPGSTPSRASSQSTASAAGSTSKPR